MMHLSHLFGIHETREFHALELPYEGNGTSMVILMPQKRVGLAELERTLTKEKMAHIRGEMWQEMIDVVLPKFKFEYTRELSDDFRAMGANRIFEEGLMSFYMVLF